MSFHNQTFPNSTVAPVNITTVAGLSGNFSIPTSTSIALGPVFWNGSSWIPVCITCYPQVVTVEPPLVDYTYTYIYYCLLLLLLVVIVVSVKMGVNRRNQFQKQQAAAIRRQNAAQNRRVPGRDAENSFIGSTSSININAESSCQMGAKTSDSPPSYADVIQPQSNGKQQDANEEEANAATLVAATPSSSTNNVSNGISTINIETDIPNNVVVDIRSESNPTNASNPTNVVSSLDILATPAAHAANMVDIEKSKDHIV